MLKTKLYGPLRFCFENEGVYPLPVMTEGSNFIKFYWTSVKAFTSNVTYYNLPWVCTLVTPLTLTAKKVALVKGFSSVPRQEMAVRVKRGVVGKAHTRCVLLKETSSKYVGGRSMSFVFSYDLYIFLHILIRSYFLHKMTWTLIEYNVLPGKKESQPHDTPINECAKTRKGWFSM